MNTVLDGAQLTRQSFLRLLSGSIFGVSAGSANPEKEK